MKKTLLKRLPIILVFLIGLAVLLYPFMGNIATYFKQMQDVAEYKAAAADISESEKSSMLAMAQDYNKNMASGEILDPFSNNPEEETSEDDEYEDVLDMGEGVMGYLEIPKIDVSVLIYHNATEIQLQKGVGHLKGTSLPIGGIGTHSVLSGHSGIPGKQLFNDLEKLELGDKFFITVLDETIAYKVDQVKVVLPTERDDLAVDPAEDYCTLITCTPTGLNTHRLLVRGIRTPYSPGDENDEAKPGSTYFYGMEIPNWTIWAILAGIMLVIIFIIIFIIKKRKKKKKEEEMTDDSGAVLDAKTDEKANESNAAVVGKAIGTATDEAANKTEINAKSDDKVIEKKSSKKNGKKRYKSKKSSSKDKKL